MSCFHLSELKFRHHLSARFEIPTAVLLTIQILVYDAVLLGKQLPMF